jgi:hypothetical protein
MRPAAAIGKARSKTPALNKFRGIFCKSGTFTFIECRIMPGQVVFRVFFHVTGVFKQSAQIVQGVDTLELAGMDRAHKQIPHPGAAACLVKQRIFTVQNGMF